MKLISFQSMDALKDLVNKGYLECDKNYINMQKAGFVYTWVVEKMNQIVSNPTNAVYPLWAWVKCYNGVCPPKHKGNPVNGFDVKITFRKPELEVFVTDFRRFSFLLSNIYIPDSLADKEAFDRILQQKGISYEELKAYARPDKYDTHREDKEFLEVCEKIRESFDRCITKESDVLQGCVWRINLDEVESIELLHDKENVYGSLNYIRKNGKRINWRKDFYKMLAKNK